MSKQQGETPDTEETPRHTSHSGRKRQGPWALYRRTMHGFLASEGWHRMRRYETHKVAETALRNNMRKYDLLLRGNFKYKIEYEP